MGALGFGKKIIQVVCEKVQHTHRGGSDLEKVDLLTSNFTVCAELELWRHVWIDVRQTRHWPRE